MQIVHEVYCTGLFQSALTSFTRLTLRDFTVADISYFLENNDE